MKTDRMRYLWARFVMWWETDVWGWLTDVACSNPSGGHCIGRRTGKPIPCEDCDRGVVIDDKA
jgi:hypothetical protein